LREAELSVEMTISSSFVGLYEYNHALFISS